MSAPHLVLLICSAGVAVQIGAYVWAALLPELRQTWAMGPAEAGAVTGAFYFAYMAAAPILVSLTDRIDAKRVYLVGASLVALGHLGFAFAVDGFLPALVCRALAGVGWAGVYMTGLKLLADRVDARLMRRAVAWHAAGLGVSGALSFLMGDLVAGAFGWQAAFGLSGALAVVATLLVLVGAPTAPPPVHDGPRPALLDFRPVLKNRAAMAYALTYCVHTWEMSVLRGWIVAFLVYVAVRAPDAAAAWATPAMAATALALVGVGMSVYGNELSIRIGRPRIVLLATLLSAAASALLGFAGPEAYSLAVALALIAGAAIWLDSSTLTGGTSEAAAPGERGRTLALHTTLGYAGGAAGPVVMGLILAAFSDADGYTDLAWGLGFLHVAVLGLLIRVVFKRLVAPAAAARH